MSARTRIVLATATFPFITSVRAIGPPERWSRQSFGRAIFPLEPAPMRWTLLITIAMLTACTAPGGPYPSLRPRTAEAIDPRVPVDRPMNDRPVAGSLVVHLAALVGQAESGDT